jgi:3-dehydroquinate synthase
MTPLKTAHLSSGKSEIEIFSEPALERICEFVQAAAYSSSIMITSSTLYSLYGSNLAAALSTRLPCRSICVPNGEEAKTLEMANKCWIAMKQGQLDRRSVVISLGGGTVSDLAGFVAGTYMRGIPLLSVPTTLLGMVDAALGGKCGINLQQSKNLIGIFNFPEKILISLDYLASLPDRELRSGLAEVIKYGIICEPKLFEYVENQLAAILEKERTALKEVIYHSCVTKIEITEKDERDLEGIRARLNFGHTLGHALEELTGYSTFVHGEAISIGMCFAARVSLALGFASEKFVQRIENLILRAGLPIRLPKEIDSTKVFELMRGDKKAIKGKIKLILVKELGQAFQQEDVSPTLILEVIDNLKG